MIRWLTRRGNFKFVDDKMVFDGTRNNPILKWKDGKCITRKEAEDELGFKTKVLWTDAKYFHASQVEAGIQKTLHASGKDRISQNAQGRSVVEGLWCWRDWHV